MSLWWGICIVSIIILMITMALVAMYASDVFDFASESYNDTAIPALFIIALVSAFGVYVSVDKLSKPSSKKLLSEERQNDDTSRVQRPVSMSGIEQKEFFSRATQNKKADVIYSQLPADLSNLPPPPPLKTPPPLETFPSVDLSKLPPPIAQREVNKQGYTELPTPPGNPIQ